MRTLQWALLPVAALALAACADRRAAAPVGPSAQVEPDFVIVLPPSGIVFKNFGPGNTFDTNPSHAWTINGFMSAGTGQQAISQQFTPAGDATLGYVAVALTLWQGAGTARVILQQDAAGLPGDVIEEMPLEGIASTPALLVATSELQPVLHRDTPYWLTIAAGGDGVLLGWQWNSIGDASRAEFASTQGGGPAGPWGLGPTPSTRGAFLIAGTGVLPQDGMRLLIAGIDFLGAHGLFPTGPGEGVKGKLGAAIASLDRGATRAGCNQLNAFNNQIQALIRTGALSQAIGNDMLFAGNRIRERIGCGGVQ